MTKKLDDKVTVGASKLKSARVDRSTSQLKVKPDGVILKSFQTDGSSD